MVELINYSLQLSSNAASVWQSGDYYHKQRFQKLVFPKGIWFDAKNNDYRTEEINCIFALNAHLSRVAEESKMETSQFFFEKSPLVHQRATNSNKITKYLAKIDTLKHLQF